MTDPTPAARAPRRRVPWMLGVLVLALLALIAGGVVRARRDTLARARARAAGSESPPAADPGADGDSAEIAELLRRARSNPGLLIEAYAAWASDPAAQGKRRVVLGALAAQPQPMARLGALLAAAQASPLPLEADPLRRDIVAAVSSVWTGPLIRRGRDLLFAEARPRSRQLVIASFVELALSDRAAALDPAQRSGITSDFIDLYARASADQRRDVVAVVRKLGGDDAAELLQGHGLGKNSTLDHHLEHQRNVEAAMRAAAAPH